MASSFFSLVLMQTGNLQVGNESVVTFCFFFPGVFYLGSLPATVPVPPVELPFSGSSEIRLGGGNREGIKEIVTCLILLD